MSGLQAGSGREGLVMKEPTYSVFVRFRRGQRLTLRRFAPLDVALRFAAQVRSERFHNADDVFIVDDASGETVVEASASGVVETCSDAPPTSAVQSSRPEGEDDLDALLKHVDRWQLRHAVTTLRGGQRLVGAVERTLDQLTTQMEHLTRSRLFDSELPKVLVEIALAAEQVRKVREGLHQLGMRIPNIPA